MVVMPRDPNKFRIQKDCKGCGQLWDTLVKQDDVLARLRAEVEHLQNELKKKEIER